jgi:uroporphyrinogen-III synthase
LEAIVAPFATQEGVIELLKQIQGSFVIPRSKCARTALTDYLRGSGKRYLAIDLYDTVCQKLEPVPHLEDFEEIVFTSPSTVEGFLQIFGALPRNKRLIAIGPITRLKLEKVYEI